MASVEIRALVGKLNGYAKRMLEAAAGLCVSRGNYEVTIEHFLLECIDDANGDFQHILRNYEIEPSRVKRAIQQTIDAAPAGNTRKPVFSRLLVELLEQSWLWASVETNARSLRSGATIFAMLSNPNRFVLDEYYDLLKPIGVEDLKSKFSQILAASAETVIEQETAGDSGKPAAEAGEKGALAQFAVNFTDRARNGDIDPVFGREREIRQMIDILARRRKNNPIVVGEPGVGKTAVVEGLALKIVQGDVPPILKDVQLHGLDMGLLQAGASVKGQFEQRLKSVIAEVKASPTPIILFIDEAHTMIGAGGAAGGGDAANLLKPALARGEMRTIAATTWSEYKKYFEKDPALARRFQLVKVDEPDVNGAVLIMRGLRENYEKAHDVYVRDDAVVAAAELSSRFISGRQLPDKAVDLLDTACARVKISMGSQPEQLDDLSKQKATLERELFATQRDEETGAMPSTERVAALTARMADITAQMAVVRSKWEKEKALADQIIALRKRMTAKGEAAVDSATAEKIRGELQAAERTLLEVQGDEALVHFEVTPSVVGHVVADWTGIPVGDMIRDEASAVLKLSENIGRRIKGQDIAISRIAERIKTAKAGLGNPSMPMGVFLLVGPSGVGKTETGLTIAETLFGGERFVVTINMSEFQEKHTLSRLVGSPPGYVGYGEGGVLTEAVRQRPYSVVLLDECEKADLEVMNLFYQVFDKGTLSDGEGRVIDFKNTIILLTSNLASDVITQMAIDNPQIEADQLVEAIRPILSDHFKPALLARMDIVPFLPISQEALRDIARLKMKSVGKRMAANQKITLTVSDEVIEAIAQRCTEVETGARNVDYIINRTVLPQIATDILHNMAEEKDVDALHLGVGEGGQFTYTFSASAP